MTTAIRTVWHALLPMGAVLLSALVSLPTALAESARRSTGGDP